MKKNIKFVPEQLFILMKNNIFNVYTITIPLPNRKDVLTQIIYSTLINNLDFSVNINYTNKKYGNEMLSAFRSSKFKKQEN